MEDMETARALAEREVARGRIYGGEGGGWRRDNETERIGRWEGGERR